jgi:hypothetical protein
VVGGFGLKLAPAVVILCKLLFRPYDPYRLRVIGREREPLRIPELERIVFTLVLLGAVGIGGRLANNRTADGYSSRWFCFKLTSSSQPFRSASLSTGACA